MCAHNVSQVSSSFGDVVQDKAANVMLAPMHDTSARQHGLCMGCTASALQGDDECSGVAGSDLMRRK